MALPGFWAQDVNKFCEAEAGGYPEYFSSISAIALIGMGLYGAYTCFYHSCDTAAYTYTALILNGIVAFGFHYTGTLGFGRLDMLTLILIAYLLTCLSIETCIYPWILGSPPFSKRNKMTFYVVKMVFRIVWLRTVVCMFVLDSARARNDSSYLMIACGMISYAALFVSLEVTWNKELHKSQHYTILSRMSKMCLISMLIATVYWLTEFALCTRFYKYWRFIPTHAIWHLGAACSITIGIQILAYYSLQCERRNPQIQVLQIPFGNPTLKRVLSLLSTFFYFTKVMEEQEESNTILLDSEFGTGNGQNNRLIGDLYRFFFFLFLYKTTWNFGHGGVWQVTGFCLFLKQFITKSIQF
jgi:hypothetical protein